MYRGDPRGKIGLPLKRRHSIITRLVLIGQVSYGHSLMAVWPTTTL